MPFTRTSQSGRVRDAAPLHRHSMIRSALVGLALLTVLAAAQVSAQSTPEVGCLAVATPAAGTNHGDAHSGHSEPEAASFDQLYIDMMVPHHEAVIALAEVALPELTDPVLIEMASNIITAQTDENAQLSAWREAWFGESGVMKDDATMTQMLEAMPVGTMDEMMFQMDPAAQMAAFCAADDPDRAFAEQVLAHHQMAVDASEIAVEQAGQPEIVAFAEQVIVDQQAEIDLLQAFLAGPAATPAA